jgi:hypothetical protein
MRPRVKDWRYVVRICNIDYSALVTSSRRQSDEPDDPALERLPRRYSANYGLSLHAARVRTMLRIQQFDKTNVNLTTKRTAARRSPSTSVRRRARRVNDRLTNSESTISFTYRRKGPDP